MYMRCTVNTSLDETSVFTNLDALTLKLTTNIDLMLINVKEVPQSEQVF